MFNTLALGLVIGASAGSAFSQAMTDIPAPPGKSAYAQGIGTVTRSAHGLCWRTGYWTEGDAVTGCDGPLAPPVANPTAPAFVATPATVPAAVAPAPLAAAPKQCDFSTTLANDQTFGFNRATLSVAAKKRIDAEVLSKLSGCARIEALSVTAHTDRIGSQSYNQQLSEKRARTVAAYLKGKGVAAQISAAGAGKTQSIQSCHDRLGRKKLIECLAPNRRVVIEARGTAK